MQAKKFFSAGNKDPFCRHDSLFQGLEQTFQNLELISQGLERTFAALEQSACRAVTAFHLLPVGGVRHSIFHPQNTQIQYSCAPLALCPHGKEKNLRDPRYLRMKNAVK